MKVKKLAAIVEAFERTVAVLDSPSATNEITELKDALQKRQSLNTDFLIELIDWKKSSR